MAALMLKHFYTPGSHANTQRHCCEDPGETI